MAYIRIVKPEEATGQLAADFKSISDSYSNAWKSHIPTPQVYRTSSIVGSYFHFGWLQNSALTRGGTHPPQPENEIPKIAINFGVSFNSSCFY